MSGKARGTLTGLAVLALVGGAAAQGAKPTAVVQRGVAITLKVGSFETARQAAIKAAVEGSGGIVDSKVDVTEKGRKHGWMRISVPSDRLGEVVPKIYGLGTLYGDKMLTADRTSEYQEIARRMDQLGKHEVRLANVLNSPRRMRGSDILYIQERLFRAGVDSESLAQHRQDLARSATHGSIILTMFEPTPIKPPPHIPSTVGEHVAVRFNNAWVSFRRFGLAMVEHLAFLVTYAVVWVPLAIVGWIVGKKVWRRWLKPFFIPPDNPTPTAA